MPNDVHTGTENVELPFVAKAMEEAVRREIENPTIPEERLKEISRKSNSRIAGFRVNDKEKHKQLIDDARASIKERWESFQDNCASIREELSCRELEPRAMLTTSAWRRLYQKAGLYEMLLDERGMAHVDTSVFMNEVEKLRRGCVILLNTVLVTSLIGAWIACSMLFSAVTSLPLLAGLPLTAVILCIIGMFSGLFCLTFDIEPDDLYHGIQKIFGRIGSKCGMYWVVTTHNHNEVLRKLMPDQRTPDYGDLAHVELPDPPQDVEDILLKAQGLRLKTAADPELISITGGLKAILERANIKEEEARRELREIARDPIITYEKDGVVAILAQFGPSPIEKRVVELVMNAGDII